MTLDEFITKHGIGLLPVMDEEQFREFVNTPCIAIKMQEWKKDVIEYYKNPNARLDLVKKIHRP